RRLEPADRSALGRTAAVALVEPGRAQAGLCQLRARQFLDLHPGDRHRRARAGRQLPRSEEHTSELQSRENLVCRLLREKKNTVPSANHRPRLPVLSYAVNTTSHLNGHCMWM